MKVGLVLPMFSGSVEAVRDVARRAEALGFDGVFATDHLFRPGNPDGPSLETFETLSSIGVEFQDIAVGSLVARVGLRTPAMLAKMAASIDDMTSGRFILGLGSGDDSDRPEHEMFGVPGEFEAPGRYALLAETAEAVKGLFDGEGWQGGEHTPEIPGPLLPPPSRAGGPPVWIGGVSDEIARMAGRIADGWNGWGMSASDFGRSAAIVAEEASARRRRCEPTWAGVAVVAEDEAELPSLAAVRRAKGLPEAWMGTPAGLIDFSRELAAAGATWMILAVTGVEGRMELIAEAALPEISR